MEKLKNKNLADLALQTWIKIIDRDQHELNARREVNYILKKHYNQYYNTLEKIKKCKDPKRLY